MRRLIICALGLLGSAAFMACNGKVVTTGGSGPTGSGSTATSTAATTTGGTTTGGTQCMTTVSAGSGPQGPSTVKETKCFKPGASTCPSAANAAMYLTPDSCYGIQSVTDQCTGMPSGICCYDVVEQLMCLG
jgi:hypothetical protein